MQSEPSSPSFVPHGHAWAKANLTHRNWTGVGLCGFPNEGTVDPRGLITPWFFSPSVDLWVLSGGKLTCPSELESVEQRLVDDLPIVQTLSLIHISEPTRLGMISYAVFCLKKKKTKTKRIE